MASSQKTPRLHGLVLTLDKGRAKQLEEHIATPGYMFVDKRNQSWAEYPMTTCVKTQAAVRWQDLQKPKLRIERGQGLHSLFLEVPTSPF